jgi:hypothetical protein
VVVHGEFEGWHSTRSLNLSITSAPVWIQAIGHIQPGQNGRILQGDRAFRGTQGQATAQAQLGVTLSNGRKLVDLFSNEGVALIPGLVSFTTGTPGAVSVGRRAGIAALLSNYPYAVDIEAAVVSSSDFVRRKTSFYCNLDPGTIGDADLGAPDGPPLRRQIVG